MPWKLPGRKRATWTLAQHGAREARLTCGAREVGVHHSLVIGILIQIHLENKVPRRFVILLGACDARALSGRANTLAPHTV